VNRKEARENGLLFYTDCKPCPNGHAPKRYVSTCCCYECKLIGRGGHAEKYREKNKERGRRYRLDDVWREKINARQKEARKNPKNARKNRNTDFKKRLGITLDEADVMLSRQGGACAICARDLTGVDLRRRPVDHDHATGKVRAILCCSCNTGLGKFKDSPILLAKAARYVEHHSGKA
jgi:hypothetical protein